MGPAARERLARGPTQSTRLGAAGQGLRVGPKSLRAAHGHDRARRARGPGRETLRSPSLELINRCGLSYPPTRPRASSPVLYAAPSQPLALGEVRRPGPSARKLPLPRGNAEVARASPRTTACRPLRRRSGHRARRSLPGERSLSSSATGKGSYTTSRREPGRDEPRVLMTIAVSVQPGTATTTRPARRDRVVRRAGAPLASGFTHRPEGARAVWTSSQPVLQAPCNEVSCLSSGSGSS
jgi:hypothetical protein